MIADAIGYSGGECYRAPGGLGVLQDGHTLLLPLVELALALVGRSWSTSSR